MRLLIDKFSSEAQKSYPSPRSGANKNIIETVIVVSKFNLTHRAIVENISTSHRL